MTFYYKVKIRVLVHNDSNVIQDKLSLWFHYRFISVEQDSLSIKVYLFYHALSTLFTFFGGFYTRDSSCFGYAFALFLYLRFFYLGAFYVVYNRILTGSKRQFKHYTSTPLVVVVTGSTSYVVGSVHIGTYYISKPEVHSYTSNKLKLALVIY